jgi:cell division protein FtsW (lipid II flippase)
MYEAVLVLHSLLRWAVVVTGAVAIARGAGGWAGRRPWTPADAAAARWFVMAMSVQFVVGLLLWAFLSPYGAASFSDMAGTMKDATRRFWAVEHITMMILALGVAHVGAARVRKAREDARRHRSALIFFVLSIVLVLIAIPWTGTEARPWVRWF